jgi:rod shape-determining protein MreC
MRNGGENRGRLLLVILIVSSLFLITLDLRGVNVLDGLRNGTQTALSPFQRAGNVVLTPVKNFVNDITHLGRTRNQIEDLRKQNQKLREQLILRKNQDGEIEQLKSILDLAGTARFKIVSAKVISQGSSLAFTRTITIDSGSGNGIKKNMTVISGSGLVGVVKEVFTNSSIVMLATDPAFKVGVRIAGSQQIGILAGLGSSSANLQLLDNQTTIKVGDVLLARGSANAQPFVPGVPVGRVSSVSNAAGAVTQSATVKYFANFGALGVVSVVVKAPKADPRDALAPVAPVPTPIPTVTVFVTPSPSTSPSASSN